MPRLLELFCGTKSVGKVFEEKGYEVVSLDYNPKFNATYTVDILLWDYQMYSPGYFDVIWASPDCTTWSLASGGKYRTKGSIYGFDEKAMTANLQIDRVLSIIDWFRPKYWFIENPRGLLQYYPPLIDFMDRHSADKTVVYYGNYNDWGYPKPTNIWSNVPLWHDEKFPNLDPSKYEIKWHKYNKAPKKYYKAFKTNAENRSKIPPDLITKLSRLMSPNQPSTWHSTLANT